MSFALSLVFNSEDNSQTSSSSDLICEFRLLIFFEDKAPLRIMPINKPTTKHNNNGNKRVNTLGMRSLLLLFTPVLLKAFLMETWPEELVLIGLLDLELFCRFPAVIGGRLSSADDADIEDFSFIVEESLCESAVDIFAAGGFDDGF